jgi:uncharacterized protein YbjT (DUF2867 family)
MTILITGGTGTLGRPTVERLRANRRPIRILSRRAGADHVLGDVTTGAGLADAMRDVDTVLHLATSAGSKDVEQTRNVIDAAAAAGVTHLIYISIVGVDDIPFGYFRAKLASEQIIERSGIPFTILRATQFHDLIPRFVRTQRWLPVVLSLDIPDQPIAVEEVADRLVELVDAGPSGRVADIGGPEVLPLRELISTWQRAVGSRKPVWTIRLGGKTIRAFKESHHMTPLPGYGRERFATFAARDAG